MTVKAAKHKVKMIVECFTTILSMSNIIVRYENKIETLYNEGKIMYNELNALTNEDLTNEEYKLVDSYYLCCIDLIADIYKQYMNKCEVIRVNICNLYFSYGSSIPSKLINIDILIDLTICDNIFVYYEYLLAKETEIYTHLALIEVKKFIKEQQTQPMPTAKVINIFKLTK